MFLYIPVVPMRKEKPPLIPTESMIEDDEGEDIYDDTAGAM